jgi:hypothetical protein
MQEIVIQGIVISGELMLELTKWAQANAFDMDQDPAEDSADERLVRAFFKFKSERDRKIAEIRMALSV